MMSADKVSNIVVHCKKVCCRQACNMVFVVLQESVIFFAIVTHKDFTVTAIPHCAMTLSSIVATIVTTMLFV